MKVLKQALAAGLALAFVAGCAQNVGDINRVQPNFVRKADFEGEWYIRQTIADVGPMASFSFKGMQLDMEKVRWEITETHLIAYRSHELYPGLNPLADHSRKAIGNTPYRDDVDDGHYSDFYKDAPVAAYRIQTHFDIQRTYNPATGEQTNVIVENMSDRPWHERKFMRVDWSNNQITHLTADARRDAVRFPDPCPSFIDMAQYIPSDMEGEWAFKMETRAGEEWTPHVYDPTDSTFVEDNRADYIDFTNRLFVQPPMLAFNLGGGQTVCVAACYLIAGTNDCTGQEVKVRTSILRVPEERTFQPRAFTDHDMMKFGFFRTERKLYHRRLGERDDNFLRYANIHNIWETAFDRDGDALSYDERQAKPIYYHLSVGYPEDLYPQAERIAADWSYSLAMAVAGSQSRDVEDVMAQFPTHDAEGNYINQGLWRLDYNQDGEALVGDLRYNFLYWVDQPQLRAPLGYGPSSADPETGEIISAQSFVFGASVDTYAQHAMEVVLALMGEYDIDEISRGEDIKDFLEQYNDNVAPSSSLQHSCKFHGIERDELQHIPVDDIRLENLDPSYDARFEAIRQVGLEAPFFEGREARMHRLKGTPYEAMMVNDEIRAAMPTLDLARSEVNAEVIEAARPFTTDIMSSQRLEQIRQDWASHHCIWLQEFSDPAVFGLATWIKDRMEQDGWNRDEAYAYLRGEIFHSVMTHEIGHTMGLRHNFQGTFDSINYFDDYWDMRKENLVPVVHYVSDLERMSTPTEAQIEGRMSEYQYSTVMDYTGRFSNDMQGLGRYDNAAIMFGYGEAVEVFETVGSQFRNRYFKRYGDGSPYFEDRLSPAYEHLLDVTHYTRIPYLMGDGDPELGIQRMRNRRVVPYSLLEEMRDPNHPSHDSRWAEVPYMFCTDHEVGLRGSCHRWVMGADMFEQARYLIESWENYYWFSHFRRGRWGWQASTALNRSFNRFSYFPNFYQHWLWGVHFEQTVDDPVQQLYMQMAAVEGINHLGKVLSTPTYGSYWYDEESNSYQWSRYYQDLSSADLFVPRGFGRRPASSYDVNAGLMYHWYQQETGHFWDYVAALLALSESTATVAGVDTQADFQNFYIPYYLVWDTQIDRLYGGIYSFTAPPIDRETNRPMPLEPGDVERARTFAPRIIDGELVHRPLVDFMRIQTDEDPYPDDPIVVPYLTSSGRFYTLIYGMFGFVSTLDLDFAEKNRVFRLGTGHTLEPGPGYEVVSFANPLNGIVYGALHRTGDDPTPAVEMITQANELKEKVLTGEAPEWRLGQLVDWLEVMGDLARVFGSPFGG